MNDIRPIRSAHAMLRTTGLIVLLAALCLPWADFSIETLNPGHELAQLALGLLQPTWPDNHTLLTAMLNTLAFAFEGVALGAVLGFALALVYRWRAVRVFAASVRAVHELFWALLFIQLFGLSTPAGVLAIAVPYAGIFAKVYGELFEEVDPTPGQTLPEKTSVLSRLLFTTLPQAWPNLAAYTRYRLECGLRSSAVLGFIGLPTLGYHLESLLRQGFYAEGAVYFYALLLLIATLPLWCRRRALPVFLIGSLFWLPPVTTINPALMTRFLTHDIVPAPLRNGHPEEFIPWLHQLWSDQIAPGVGNTLVLSMLALVLMGVIGLISFPAVSTLFGNRVSRLAGHGVLVVLRSLPEYLLAFMALMLLGPSMLPAVLALGLHNGAIVGHLVGQYSNTLTLRLDAARGLNRYFFEVLPRQYRLFLAFTLYRFETVIRETAILGMLGIPTLGFFIDSAFSEFRFDRAMVLLIATALLNIGVDAAARSLRQRLHLKQQLVLC
ncbi:PhnE/PtxC family ABC transporter permease [Saccharospirillum mangrovi]|uniref:PhnE/PtxC family ABC transporter permease n=1 Tax=Saccharospirillum mangrovi TaxID=2161747 RepID=UPI0018E4FBC4|nr:ABC transporter permease [Saccharospirillum mangrovi]